MPDPTGSLGDHYHDIATNRLTGALYREVVQPGDIPNDSLIIGLLVKIIEQLTVLTQPRPDPRYGAAVRLAMSSSMAGVSTADVPFLAPAAKPGKCADCGIDYSIGAPIVVVVHPNGGYEEPICETCCRKEES